MLKKELSVQKGIIGAKKGLLVLKKGGIIDA